MVSQVSDPTFSFPRAYALSNLLTLLLLKRVGEKGKRLTIGDH
jgi:hypothetical protein